MHPHCRAEFPVIPSIFCDYNYIPNLFISVSFLLEQTLFTFNPSVLSGHRHQLFCSSSRAFDCILPGFLFAHGSLLICDATSSAPAAAASFPAEVKQVTGFILGFCSLLIYPSISVWIDLDFLLLVRAWRISGCCFN